jgi:hypothetical protein
MRFIKMFRSNARRRSAEMVMEGKEDAEEGV